MSPYLRWLRERVGHDLLVLPSVTALIFDNHRQVLLVRPRNSTTWTTPGGTIEPHERPADACVREAWEETGLRVRPERLVGVFGGPEFEVHYPNGDRAVYTMAVFECSHEPAEPRSVDDEIAEIRWVAEQELSTLELPEWARRVLTHAWVPATQGLFTPPQWQPPLRR